MGLQKRAIEQQRITFRLVLFGALLLVGLCVPTAATAQTVTDQNLTNYLDTIQDAPEAFSGTHGNVLMNFHSNVTPPAPPTLRWHVDKAQGLLVGGWTPWPPVLSPDGKHLWMLSGRGRGYSSALELDAHTGKTLWASEPYDGTAQTIDPWTVVNAPVIDPQANVYFSDSQYLYSFSDDGRLRWKTAMPAGDGRPLIQGQGFFTNEGLYGGLTVDGWWLFVNPKNGKIQILQEYLPTKPFRCPVGFDVAGLAAGLLTGIYAPELGTSMLCVTLSASVKAPDTGSYDPETGNIFVETPNADGTAARTTSWRIDGNKLKLRWQTELPGTVTNTALLSNATDQVIVLTAGKYAALSKADGHLLWKTADPYQYLLQPTLDAHGNVLINSFNSDELSLISAKDGSVLWRRNYDDLAPQAGLPTGPSTPVVPDGRPHAFVVSLETNGPDTTELAVTFGYRATGGIVGLLGPILAVVQNIPGIALDYCLPIEQVQGTVTVRNDTGEPVPGTLRLHHLGRGPDNLGSPIDGGLINHTDGWYYSGVTEFTGLLNWLFNNPLVPDPYKVAPLNGGVFGLESDHLASARRELEDNLRWNTTALADLAPPLALQDAFDQIRRIPNLDPGALSNVDSALAAGELSSAQARDAKADIADAASAQDKAMKKLLGTPSSNDVSSARSLISSANDAISSALQTLPVPAETARVATPAGRAYHVSDVAPRANPDQGAQAEVTGAAISTAIARLGNDPARLVTQPLLADRSTRALLIMGRFAPWHGNAEQMEGLLTTFVVPLGFYDRLGLRANDVILTVNGVPMTSGAATEQAMDIFTNANVVTLEVLRNNTVITITRRFLG